MTYREAWETIYFKHCQETCDYAYMDNCQEEKCEYYMALQALNRQYYAECGSVWVKPKADRKTENSSEKTNNCEWSVEYAKEMLDTMPCEECGHWEHGAGDHYYCALLEMRQECYFEPKDESTLMFSNKPKDEPQLTPNYCGTCKHREVPCGDLPCDVCHGYSNYEPKDEPTISKMEQVDKDINVRSKDEPQTERSE